MQNQKGRWCKSAAAPATVSGDETGNRATGKPGRSSGSKLTHKPGDLPDERRVKPFGGKVWLLNNVFWLKVARKIVGPSQGPTFSFC